MKLKLFLLIISAMFLSNTAFAATYYISPSGSDGGAGDAGSPWRTFAFAIPKLNPGDTLLLRDGTTYGPSTTGVMNITCGSTAKNGTASAPITVKAENERRAFFNMPGGQSVVRINNCSYWVIQGIHAEDKDNANFKSSYILFDVRNSNHITFRRNLFMYNNRYANTGFIQLLSSDHNLVEENEFYTFHRHATLIKHSDYNIYRRNYSNSRLRTDVGGGFPSDPPNKGDTLVTIYPGSNNLLENNIAEQQSSVTDIQAIDASQNNREYGDITLNTNAHALLARRPRETNSGPGPVNYYMENVVSVAPQANTIYARGATNTIINHVSIFGSGASAIVADPGALLISGVSYAPSPLPISTHVQNSLIVGAKGIAASFIQQNSFGVDHSNLFQNSQDFNPAASPTYTNITKVDPQMGACRVFIPSGSPMKGKGTNGEDIGANILCRYENGVLTKTQLWNWQTGQFPCGAMVSGVNDIAGSSCMDVHRRLNVNTNGCTLPATASCDQPAPPDGFTAGGGTTFPCI